MLVAVLSDTHIPKKARDLPTRAYELMKGVDAIIHAGDLVSGNFLKVLEKVAPVYAVRGNNDHNIDLPEILNLEWQHVSIAVIHDSGDKKGRASRMKRQFPQAGVVVFGHSHIPLIEYAGDLLLFNPGSPTDRRRQKSHTMGLMMLEDGVVTAQIVELD